MAEFMGLTKQAAQMQAKMQELQTELDHTEVEGTSGGGMVTVRLTAKGEMKGIAIDPSLLKAEEKEILEDLLIRLAAGFQLLVRAGYLPGVDAVYRWSFR